MGFVCRCRLSLADNHMGPAPQAASASDTRLGGFRHHIVFVREECLDMVGHTTRCAGLWSPSGLPQGMEDGFRLDVGCCDWPFPLAYHPAYHSLYASAMPVDTVPADATPRDMVPADATPRDTVRVDVAPVDGRPVDAALGDAMSADVIHVDARTVDTVPVNAVPVDVTPVDARPVGTVLVDARLADAVPANVVPMMNHALGVRERPVVPHVSTRGEHNHHRTVGM